MANERISMRKIRDIIRLREKGLGYRQIGRALRITHPVVSQYARDFAATGLSYAQIKGISRQRSSCEPVRCLPLRGRAHGQRTLATLRWALGLSAAHGN